ncbi:molybdate transporter periplasmic protein [Enterobacter cancerogenus]|uniref:Molybdate transporter periplasmic protein n=1 Tax=Enterobacter cancerogenus TaxID=69218 RepID=A0A484WY89_9ENTR|nr:molybdate transporter periplasmic protein [Enterobacter cancerogenus]
MAGTWVRLFAGATLTLSLAGHALADEGKITVFAACIAHQCYAGYRDRV